MRRSLLEAIGLIGIASILTFGYYMIIGEPDRAVQCVPEELEPHHICVSTVAEDWAGNVQWIDARPRVDWERNGLEGSVLLTDDPKEDFNELLATSMEAVFLSSQLDQKVVIYCNGVSCGSSKAVFTKLMEQGIYDEIYILHGGWKALSQELAKEESPLNTGS